MLRVSADVPVRGWDPSAEWRTDLLAHGATLDPAALVLGFLLVGWIAEDHGDFLLALDCVRVPAGLAERQEDLGKVFLLGVGIAKRVGHEEAHRR